MRITGIGIIALAVLSVAAPCLGRARIEFGTHGNVVTSLAREYTLLDGFRLRAILGQDTDGSLHIEPALTWQYQRHFDTWAPFMPSDHSPARRGRVHSPSPPAAHFVELTLLARAIEGGRGLHPFAELETGVAFNSAENADPDIVASFVAGAAWKLNEDLVVVFSIGPRLYLPSEHLTVRARVDLSIGL